MIDRYSTDEQDDWLIDRYSTDDQDAFFIDRYSTDDWLIDTRWLIDWLDMVIWWQQANLLFYWLIERYGPDNNKKIDWLIRYSTDEQDDWLIDRYGPDNNKMIDWLID